MNHKVGMPTRKIAFKGQMETTVTHEVSSVDLGMIGSFLANHAQNQIAGGVIDAEEAELCD